jgi:hypothetical protein
MDDQHMQRTDRLDGTSEIEASTEGERSVTPQ